MPMKDDIISLFAAGFTFVLFCTVIEHNNCNKYEHKVTKQLLFNLCSVHVYIIYTPIHNTPFSYGKNTDSNRLETAIAA